MRKSFRRKNINLSVLFLFASTCLILAGCSKSDDQKRFEEEAFSLPDGITTTDVHGTVEHSDPDDWRISPMYRGLINLGNLGESQPPFPNPVGLNSDLYIQVNQRSPDHIQALQIDKIDSLGTSSRVMYYGSEEINSTFTEKRIKALLITGSQGANASGLYRILISDGRNNIITYGDVQIDP